eukprot:30462-Eustigmatos_ZCMA.PRE.1
MPPIGTCAAGTYHFSSLPNRLMTDCQSDNVNESTVVEVCHSILNVPNLKGLLPRAATDHHDCVETQRRPV